MNLSAGGLTDDLVARLNELAVSDQLSVRVLAGRLLDKHDQPVPDPPATTPDPSVSAAFHSLANDLEAFE